MRLRVCSLLILGLLVSMGLDAFAAGTKTKPEEAQRVELFKAVKDGLVDVKLTPKNSLECTISVTNKGAQPLMVDMPRTFAGVPVLAQPPGAGMFGEGGMMGDMGGMGGGGRRGGGSGGGGGGNQSVGGGMGGGGGGMGGMGGGGGGGWFIPPEKTVRDKVRTVCLEHGKKEPRPALNYTMVPLASYTKNKTTHVLCSMLSDQSVDQLAVQAAVWNQENSIPFNELAAKTVKKAGGTIPRVFFTRSQIVVGEKMVQLATDKVQKMDENERLMEQQAPAAESSSSMYQTNDAAKETKTGDKVDQLTEKLLSK